MNKAVDFIREKINGFVPEVALILGSGLGSLADTLEGIRIPYSAISGFAESKVIGHKSQLVFAEFSGKKVVIMQGRFHYYEGYSMEQVVFPIKVFKKLGVKKLIITNAAGCVNKDFEVGKLMLITDHINFFGVDPLRGENDDSLGTRFPDMTEIYKKYLLDIAENTANELGIKIYKGVYCGRSGPSYETPAEIKMTKVLGADATGMSTVPEAICANYCGIDVLGISCLTNYAAGISLCPLTHEEVTTTAKLVQNDFINLISKIVEKL